MLVKKQLFLLCSIQLKLVKTAQVFALILATNSTKIRVTTIIIVILAQPTHRNGGCIRKLLLSHRLILWPQSWPPSFSSPMICFHLPMLLPTIHKNFLERVACMYYDMRTLASVCSTRDQNNFIIRAENTIWEPFKKSKNVKRYR